MALICRVLLVFLAVLAALATSSGAHADAELALRCHPDQAASLLQLKKSFSFFRYPSGFESWRDGTDCCLWEGVGCSNSSGHVTALELSDRGLYSPAGLDPAIFNLTSLQLLDLSVNYFGVRSLPASGFERLPLLTHLNLSNSGFQGQIPITLGKLANLISLDLSGLPDPGTGTGHSVYRYDYFYGYDSSYGYDSVYNELSLQEPSFQILMANLSNLRELYLDTVDMSSSGDWCHALAKSLPHLRVLSLSYCNLVGPICLSLSNLHSLTVINLQGNFDTFAAPFPELFMDFPNLSVLQLAETNLQGWFPSRTFQSKTLRVLDLSGNGDLLGHVPNFSNTSSLETMMLEWTNFSFGKQSSFSNFKSLQTLSLDVNFASVELEPQYSLGIHGSLEHLELYQMDSMADLGIILSWIEDLKNLRSLELSNWNFSQTSFSSVAKLKNLKSLTFSYCNFTKPSLSAIGNLVNLRSLVITECRFNGPIPSAIGNLTNLENLEIIYGDFLGAIPSSISKLMNLRSLVVFGAYNDIGPLPFAVGNLSNLESLEIDESESSGPIPYAVGLLKKLTSLHIRNSGFSGSIPNSVFNLTRLIDLDLSNNLLSGEIPTSVFTIPTLQRLDIRFNQLFGSVQEFNTTSSHLVSVDLSANKLTGKIPKSFFQLASLVYLDICWNNLVGLVDLSSFWRLRNLAHLGLSNNNLSVMDMDGEGINSPSTYLPRVTWLNLASCNLTGFPSSLAHLNQLSYLDLSCNRISGDIPKWIWTTWKSRLTYLNLSHNMLSVMQLTSYILPFNQLQTLDVSYNQLQGQVPMPSPPAAILDYSNNNFSSVLPNFTLYLGQEFRISKNKISGHIPNSICDSTISIRVLDLSFNNFSGWIPSCLIEDGYMSALILRENQFEGVLPNNIKDQCLLQTLDLNNNKIEGQLPRRLTKCLQLGFLDFGNNRIIGTFPSWLGKLSSLRVLVLRSNRFYGSMGGDLHRDDKSKEYFSSLQILDLASNKFSGSLSPKWFEGLKSMMRESNTTGDIVGGDFNGSSYQNTVVITYKSIYRTFDKILTTLTAIDLSNNSFDGTIPGSLGRLISLHVLNMSGNAFTGEIPQEFGRMAQLESLDLSQNQLSGGIPEELANLTFLGILNLSKNQLVGRIPRSGQFATFGNISFEGNLGLCGLPLSNPCGVSPTPPSAAHVEESSHVDVILFLFIGIGFGVGFAGAILTRWGRMGAWVVKSASALSS